jgi:hypothetical protein
MIDHASRRGLRKTPSSKVKLVSSFRSVHHRETNDSTYRISIEAIREHLVTMISQHGINPTNPFRQQVYKIPIERKQAEEEGHDLGGLVAWTFIYWVVVNAVGMLKS